MSDRSWLEDADPSLRAERALLKRLNAEHPPPGSIDRGWSALSAQIAGPLPVSTRPISDIAHAAKASTSLGMAAKIVVGVTLSGAGLWTGRALVEWNVASSVSSPPPQRAAPAETSTANDEAEPQAVAGKTTDDPDPAAKSTQRARPATSATTLAEEGRLLAKAHHLVQSGQAQQALEVLQLSQSRYPRSVLYPEREVLTIEALDASGSSASAQQRAARFLKRYPNSAYAPRLKRFVE